MADFSNQTITLAGRKMLATAIAEKKQITFTRIACGDGSAPDAPEDLTDLVHHLFDINVGQVYKHETEAGTFVVSGSFVATSDKGDFSFREAGIYAKFAKPEDEEISADAEPPVEEEDAHAPDEEQDAGPEEDSPADAPAAADEEEILFAYLNAGDTADYIRSVSAASMTQIDLNFALVIGQAAVEYVYDPNALATLKAIDDAKTAVDNAIKDFTDETIADLKKQQQELITKMDAAKQELSQAEQGFLLKGGDTTTGDITMGDTFHLRGDVIGSLEGSATQWAGWQHFDDLSKFSSLSPTAATIPQIVTAMPQQSTLTLVITAKNANLPENIGMLEIRKSGTTLINCLFTAFTGNAYVGAVYNNAFTGWKPTTPVPPGVVVAYAVSSAAPLGWLVCEGGTFSKNTYPALFNILKYTWGGSGDNFKVPDTRGQFLRGWDNGRKLDNGRKFATDQQSGAPNIVGRFNGNVNDKGGGLSGCFYDTKVFFNGGDTGAAAGGLIEMNASRSSKIYKNGLTEIRVQNIALRYIIKY